MKTFLPVILLLCSCYSFSQSNSSAKKDTLVWTDGVKYAGTIINEDKHTGQVQFMTEDSQMHNVSSSSIAQLKRANQPDVNTPPPVEQRTSATSIPAQSSFEDGTPINWSDSNIPHEALKKHRSGLGLVISGTIFTVGGIVLAAGAANTSSTTYSNGVTTQSYVKVNGLGVLFILAGLPMVIVGAIKLSKASKIAHDSMIRSK